MSHQDFKNIAYILAVSGISSLSLSLSLYLCSLLWFLNSYILSWAFRICMVIQVCEACEGCYWSLFVWWRTYIHTHTISTFRVGRMGRVKMKTSTSTTFVEEMNTIAFIYWVRFRKWRRQSWASRLTLTLLLIECTEYTFIFEDQNILSSLILSSSLTADWMTV